MIHLVVVRAVHKNHAFSVSFCLTEIFSISPKSTVSELESLPAAAEVSAPRSDVNTV